MEQIRTFDKYSKKPDQRKEFLLSYGWPADKDHKRNIPVQREFVLTKLCGGSILGVEAKIHQAIVRNTVDSTLQKYCHIKAADGSFKATFSGKSQALEQSFSTVKAASSWLVEISQADED